MGTSFVEYKQHGFWSRDSYIATWIDAMITELEALKDNQSWLIPLVENWRIQAKIDGGCMRLDLDTFVVDESCRKLLIRAAQSANARCDTHARRTGELFISLISGQLKTTVSSPIDYL